MVEFSLTFSFFLTLHFSYNVCELFITTTTTKWKLDTWGKKSLLYTPKIYPKKVQITLFNFFNYPCMFLATSYNSCLSPCSGDPGAQSTLAACPSTLCSAATAHLYNVGTALQVSQESKCPGKRLRTEKAWKHQLEQMKKPQQSLLSLTKWSGKRQLSSDGKLLDNNCPSQLNTTEATQERIRGS